MKIREAVVNLKQDLANSEPRDRLDYIDSIMECIQFMKQSNIGWASLLTNPQISKRAGRGSSEGHIQQVPQDCNREDRQ